VLRIETEQHGAHIFGIDTDAANHFAVTASTDKSARVWSLPDGRLLRTLRLPLDFANIGKVYGMQRGACHRGNRLGKNVDLANSPFRKAASAFI
jgi:WD40 repeat protein